MIAYQRSHHGLLLLVKARQIAVLQNVGRVAMHPAVIDVQPDFMQHRRPLKQSRQLRMRQFRVLGFPLFIHMSSGFQHPLRLLAIDVVLIRQALRGTAANILVAESAFHLIQHAFAQRTVRQAQLANGQRIEHAAQDRQTRNKHRFALFGQARQAQSFKALMLDHLFHQHRQTLRGDKAIFFAHLHQHFMCGFNRTRGAKRHVPALQSVLPGERLQLLHRGHARTLEVFPADCSAREVDLGETDAAHPAAFDQMRLKVFANHQLGRATADIDHQLAAFFGLSMFHTHENQSGFFIA